MVPGYQKEPLNRQQELPQSMARSDPKMNTKKLIVSRSDVDLENQ